MEIRLATMSYSKSKSKRIRNREQDILWKLLDLLDSTICSNFSSPDIDDTLKECENLKCEHTSIYEEKCKQAMFRAKFRWVDASESGQQSISSI